ncbi:MAG: response regulator transcription factor [Anaerolineales bacterium]|nr:response regulator transcription factor [Anaerolineales bacterium]
MKPIRILIADDHLLLRDGLKALLGSTSDTKVIAEASTGEEAIQLAISHQPTVILMDIQMPGINGIEATRRITKELPDTNILILTMFDDDHSVFSAMRAGARGYILKGSKHDEMLRAVKAVASGEAIFSPGIAIRMIDFFSRMHPTQPHKSFTELTEREQDVLQLLARNYSNARIATELVLTPKTVRNYVSSILNKLQAADRAEAGERARQAGIE